MKWPAFEKSAVIGLVAAGLLSAAIPATAELSTQATLGRVDKVHGPQACRDDVDEAEIARGGLVVSGRQSAGVLELVEAALDAVPEGVDVVVDRDLNFSPASRRDDGGAAVGLGVRADAVGVVALVGDQHLWRGRVGVHHEVVALVVRDFPAGDLGGDREAFGVGAEMDFGREATFRAAKTLSLSPPFAPAAG